MLEAIEGIEDLFQLVDGNAGPIVIDVEYEVRTVGRPADFCGTTVANGVLKQVPQRPSERVGSKPHGNIITRGKGAVCRHIAAQAVQKIAQIDHFGTFGSGKAPCKGERRFDHALHLFDRCDEAVPRLFFVNQLRADTHSSQRRAQIVTKRCEHPCPIADKPGQPSLHAVEGDGQILDLGRPRDGQFTHILAPAKMVRGLGEVPQRTRQARHDKPEDRHQKQSGGNSKGQHRIERPLDWRTLEPRSDIQPTRSLDGDRQVHLNRRQLSAHHREMHFRHLVREIGKGPQRALDLVQFNANIPAVAIAQKRAYASFHDAAIRMTGVFHARNVRQIKPDQWRIRRAEDRVLQLRRGLLDQPRDICCATGGLEPQCGTNRKGALVSEQEQADRLGHDKCRDHKQDQLAAQRPHRTAHHGASSTSAARQYPPFRTVLMTLGLSTSGSILRRRRLI